MFDSYIHVNSELNVLTQLNIYQMIEKLLRDFAAENFGPESNYFPITHGKTQEIKPLVLLVKKRRPFWKRPLKKNTLTTIGRVDTYVTQGKNQEVQDKIDLCVKKEDPELELEMDEDEDVEQANAARYGISWVLRLCPTVRVSILAECY